MAGQLPPPIGGQNVMIAHSLDVFRRDGRLDVDHLPFGFTQTWKGARSVSVSKVLELGKVIIRLARLRARGPIDCLLYPVGGPHRNPILRDLILLPFCYFMAGNVILHFHAGGIANVLPTLPPLVRRVVKAVYARSEGAVSLTEFGMQDPLSLGIENVAVVPNVLDDHFEDLPNEDSDRIRLLYVGHLCNDKGTPQLVRAFGAIAGDFPDVDLVLMGEPIAPFTDTDLDRLIASANVGTRIFRVGVLRGEKKWRWYNRADVFVFPSQAPYESFPLVLVEAMMWRLPIVTSRWRGIPEVIGDPVPGVSFDPDPDMQTSLQAALVAALSTRERWSEWSARSRSRFVELRELASAEEPLVRHVLSVLG